MVSSKRRVVRHRVEEGAVELSVTWTGSSRCLVELLRKMSAKRDEYDGLETEVHEGPHGVLACDEPVPKLWPATRMVAPDVVGRC